MLPQTLRSFCVVPFKACGASFLQTLGQKRSLSTSSSTAIECGNRQYNKTQESPQIQQHKGFTLYILLSVKLLHVVILNNNIHHCTQTTLQLLQTLSAKEVHQRIFRNAALISQSHHTVTLISKALFDVCTAVSVCRRLITFIVHSKEEMLTFHTAIERKLERCSAFKNEIKILSKTKILKMKILFVFRKYYCYTNHFCSKHYMFIAAVETKPCTTKRVTRRKGEKEKTI